VTALVDPEGVHYKLIADVAGRTPEPLRTSLQLIFAPEKARRGRAQALPPEGPPQLLRLGHVGLYVKSLRLKCSAWWRAI